VVVTRERDRLDAVGHRTAIDALGMGLLHKVILEFADSFWPDGVETIAFTRDDHRFVEWINYRNHTSRNVLVAFTAAYDARELEAMDDASVVAAAVDVLRSAHWVRSAR